MPSVVTSDRFLVLLMIGQYLPLPMNFTDKILLLFSRKPIADNPLSHTLSKLSLLPWENPKEAIYQSLPLLQQGWQQLNVGNASPTAFTRASKEFFRGQLYCFQGICAVVNEDKTQPQLIFDYISKAKEAFSLANRLYGHSSCKNILDLLDTLIKNIPAKKMNMLEEHNAVSHSSLGRQYIEQKKWALALKHFKKAQKKHPNSLIHQTEKTLSERLKQVSELHYLCQSTPIVIRKATQKRYLEIIDENLTEIEGLTEKAHKSLIFNESDMNLWTSALSYFNAKLVK